jgi:hypothetical protein
VGRVGRGWLKAKMGLPGDRREDDRERAEKEVGAG